MRKFLESLSFENVKEYYFEAFGMYPQVDLSKEQMISLIMKNANIENVTSIKEVEEKGITQCVLEQLEKCASREEAKKILSGLKVKQLKDIADNFRIKAKNKEQYITKIINSTVGNRLEEEIINSMKLNTNFGF